MPERVVLAMSGGVDSSAAAVLLQRAGYDVIGLFMRSGATDDACAADDGVGLPTLNAKPHKQGCCSASDAADARRVADALDIPFHALNFREAFGRIKDYFADEYLAGRTPNPCVMCNNWLKFGRLWDFARQVGATKIASGHYARIVAAEPRGSEVGSRGSGVRTSDRFSDDQSADTRHQSSLHLTRGLDRSKDQSYVLFGLDRDLLANVLFPVGDLQKSSIRELARETGLRVADKPDSQEICFVPDNDYAGFLRRHRGETDTAGELVDTVGNVLGTHPGFERFTIGQRKGLGVTFGEPRFVVKIEPESKRVVIGTRNELGRLAFSADRANWLADVPAEFRCQAQIRYQHRAAEATVNVNQQGGFDVRFDEAQFGVAPGQACVLYDGERVLGGGWIC
ncbi:MAG: tRNA 2-thiouridine(34) synthase MnmA [Planctomycetota bacterium]|nr:tRNA 2-thiouridine(34) synthase MnmA [Planctomycetaceae bacterium]MDQ3332972.1 tRNA 2-thiouridine(34) synthase MnmA [Planctomycetota bacterium]